MRLSRFAQLTLVAAILTTPAAALAAVPTVNTFTVAATAVSPVPVTAFTASDSDGTVVGYMITQTTAKPAASDSRWKSTPWTSFTTSSFGAVTLYAWAKDNAAGVSNSKSAGTTVVGSHVHTIAQITGLTQALAKPAKVIVVDLGGAGNFTSPVAAMQSITDASGTNPYVVKVMPGVYEVTESVVVPPYVTLEGSGERTTEIVANNLPIQPYGARLYCNDGCPDPVATVVLREETALRNIQISNYTPGSGIAVYRTVGGESFVSHVTAIAVGNGGQTQALDATAFYVNAGAIELADVKSQTSVTSGSDADVSAIWTTPGASVTVKNSELTASGGNWLSTIYLRDGSTISIMNSTISADGSAGQGGQAIEMKGNSSVIGSRVIATGDMISGVDGSGTITGSEVRAENFAVYGPCIGGSLVQGAIESPCAVNNYSFPPAP